MPIPASWATRRTICRRRADPTAAALRHVVGYTVVNNVTAPDWQRRTLSGKTFEHTMPVGPARHSRRVSDPCAEPDLEIRLKSSTARSCSARARADLLFGIADILAYVSDIITLQKATSSPPAPLASSTTGESPLPTCSPARNWSPS